MIEKRRHERKEWGYPGRIVANAGVLPCTISDISLSGARLQVSANTEQLSEFILHFGTRTAVSRECIVRWRDGQYMGVEFQNLGISGL